MYEVTLTIAVEGDDEIEAVQNFIDALDTEYGWVYDVTNLDTGRMVTVDADENYNTVEVVPGG